MNTDTVIKVLAVLLSSAALIITMVSIWNRSQIRLELAKQQSDFILKLFYEERESNKDLRRRLEKLDEAVHNRVDEHERDVVKQLNHMQNSIHQIDINIAKLVSKVDLANK